MSKEINLSKCKHYWNGNCSNCKHELIGACPDLDCYYKQLQRKIEEIEIQKYALEAAIKENGFLKEKIVHLEGFSNELVSKYVKPICEPSLNTEIFEQKERYKSCLQEIKTLAEFEKIKDGTLIPIDEISTLFNDRNFRLMKIQEVIKKAEEK